MYRPPQIKFLATPLLREGKPPLGKKGKVCHYSYWSSGGVLTSLPKAMSP